MDGESILVLIGIIVIVIILLFNAYKQGYFTKLFGSAAEKEDLNKLNAVKDAYDEKIKEEMQEKEEMIHYLKNKD